MLATIEARSADGDGGYVVSEGFGVRPGPHLKMTVKQWAAVPDNPRQRNTAQRAESAKHLHSWHPVHALVHMAQLPDGRTYKIEGHTRSLIWSQGKVVPPCPIDVQTWICESLDDVIALFDTFDSSGAVKTAADFTYGSLSENKLALNTHMLRAGRCSSAYVIAYRLISGWGAVASRGELIRQSVNYFSREIGLLDRCEPTQRKWITGIVAAALITFRRYGEEALPFWQTYTKQDGDCIGGESDGVNALTMATLVNKKRHGYAATIRLITLACNAFEKYMAGETVHAPNMKPWKAERLRDYCKAAARAPR